MGWPDEPNAREQVRTTKNKGKAKAMLRATQDRRKILNMPAGINVGHAKALRPGRRGDATRGDRRASAETVGDIVDPPAL